MTSSLFGTSKYPKKLDPALTEFSDQELHDRAGLPDFVTDQEADAELAQRQANRELAAGGAV